MFCFLFLLVFFLCWKSFTVGFIFIFFGNIFVSFIYSGYGFFCWIFCWKCYDCNTMYLFALYYLFSFPDLLLCHISFLFPVIVGPIYPVELNLLHRCYVFHVFLFCWFVCFDCCGCCWSCLPAVGSLFYANFCC